MLVQAGLLDREGLPAVGTEQVEKVLAPRAVPANTPVRTVELLRAAA